MAKRPPVVDDLDWSRERALELGESVLGIWGELIEKLPSMPVNRRLDREEVKRAVALAVPEEPMSHAALVDYLRALVFEHSVYPGHPGFMAWICGAGTVPGALGDLVAASLNQNLAGWPVSPAATEIEMHLTAWLAERFGLPPGSGGMLTSGGAMANLTALKLARDRKGGHDAATDGMHDGAPMAFYASEEVHAVVVRAADMLGLGRRAVRHVPVDVDMRLRVDALAEAIARDRAAGVRPVAVVGTAGTTHTGAIDPLEELAALCEREDVWFHVDAAYGGAVMLNDDLRPLLRGIERADSIAFDPHKWMYTPLPGGCVLVRKLEDLARSYSVDASYTYQDAERVGFISDFKFMAPEFSRAFAGLKVWLSLLAHGRKAFARRIAHDIDLATYLGERVGELPELELGAAPSLSICCFRYVPAGLAARGDARDAYLDQLNARLMTDVQLDGRVWCSNAIIGGHFYLRMCCVNFRTEAEHMDLLLDVAIEHGRRLHGELAGAAAASG